MDFFYKVKKEYSGAAGQHTKYSKLMQIYRNTGKLLPDLEQAPCIPFCIAHVWRWFEKLNDKRQITYLMDGKPYLHPIPYTEIKSFFDLHDEKAHPVEIEFLAKIDTAYIQVMHK